MKRHGHALGDAERELDGNRVAELSHGFRPGAVEFVAIGESLQAGGLSDGEVTDAAIRMPESVFPPGHAVVSSLERLGGLVPQAACVATVASGSGIETVVGECAGFI